VLVQVFHRLDVFGKQTHDNLLWLACGMRPALCASKPNARRVSRFHEVDEVGPEE
jgi:hypothetical protein